MENVLVAPMRHLNVLPRLGGILVLSSTVNRNARTLFEQLRGYGVLYQRPICVLNGHRLLPQLLCDIVTLGGVRTS